MLDYEISEGEPISDEQPPHFSHHKISKVGEALCPLSSPPSLLLSLSPSPSPSLPLPPGYLCWNAIDTTVFTMRINRSLLHLSVAMDRVSLLTTSLMEWGTTFTASSGWVCVDIHGPFCFLVCMSKYFSTDHPLPHFSLLSFSLFLSLSLLSTYVYTFQGSIYIYKSQTYTPKSTHTHTIPSSLRELPT